MVPPGDSYAGRQHGKKHEPSSIGSHNDSSISVLNTPTSADRYIRIRGHAVILDAELAALYGVTVKRLNEQVKRNADRFPAHFMFRLTEAEWGLLRSQNATSNTQGGRR
jgi:hypothetical protein